MSGDLANDPNLRQRQVPLVEEDALAESVPAGPTPTGRGDMMAPALGPDLRGQVPPMYPGVEGDTSLADKVYGDEAAGAAAENTAFPMMQQRPKGPDGVVQGEGENYLPTQGKELFDETYVKGPQRLASAQQELGRLSANKSEALGQQYQQSAQQATEAMAANKARRAADDQEISIRQTQLDQAVTHYSNDLANQNKFWSSPGNIVSAIAFSLMPIFSNDPAIGVKLINQAIDRDMANRKDLANMHLGELRSNIGNYRKLAEDRNVGDQIAQSEAHRVAAMQIEQISSQFDSPISKAKALAMVEDQLMRANQTRMVAFNHYNYNTVRKLDPRVASAFEAPGKAGNDDAWHSFTLPAKSAGNAIGNVQGTPSTARDTSGAGGVLNQMSPSQVVALAYQPGQIVKMADSGQLQGQDLAVMARNSIVARVKSITNENSPNYELEFNKNMKAELEKAQKGSEAISKAAAPHMKGLTVTRRMASDMATIEAELKGTGITPDSFLGELRNGLGGPLASKVQALRIKYNNDATDSPAQKQSMDFLKASERFHQVLAQNIITFNHENIGGAQSPSELANIQQVINQGDGWGRIKGFVNMNNQQYAAAYENALSTAESPYAKMLYLQRNGNALTTLGRNGVAAPTVRQPGQNPNPQPQTPTPLAKPNLTEPAQGEPFRP